MGTMEVVSLISVIVGLVALVFLAMRGANPMASVPFCALFIAVVSGMAPGDAMLTVFATGFANMVRSMAFMIASSAMLGRCLMESGSVQVIADWIADTFGAERVCWAMVVGCGILTYGGMGWGVYVVMFPVGHILCQKANINRNILLAAIISGCWTFAMVGPFTPTPHNAIAGAYFGTNAMAGLIPGLAASVLFLLAGGIYTSSVAKKWRKNGIVFDSQELLDREVGSLTSYRPKLVIALIPIVVVLILFNAFKWPIPGAMLGASIICIILNFKAMENPLSWFGVINKGCNEGMAPVVNLCVMGGLGAVISATPFFQWLLGALATSTMHPYILSMLICFLFSVLLGSASSGVTLTLNTVGPTLLNFVQMGGYDVGNLHRLLCLTAGPAAGVPHNGTLVSIFKSFELDPKKTFMPMFIAVLVIPTIIVFAVALPLAMLGFK